MNWLPSFRLKCPFIIKEKIEEIIKNFFNYTYPSLYTLAYNFGILDSLFIAVRT